jgi:alpha-glucosidase (family GH31 glycosyl hydrolase)
LRNVSRYGNQAFLFIPFIYSSGGDGFYFNAGSKDTFVFTGWKSGRIGYIPAGQAYDFYFCHEPAPQKQLQHLYELVGRPRLLPRWAFGYLQSKYGVGTEARSTLVREIRKACHPGERRDPGPLLVRPMGPGLARVHWPILAWTVSEKRASSW